ncbi:unnamed protein product [Macrosiphum euphorbiae]|uniref:Uncharacterized protein n=1 Tax=Macrosiphum euphorbiae TaxID=13131 RepID=A0AAV0XQ62_9HEMI|nr:unnamed protein product [Macrosiphum euphorbiae]
MVVERRRLGVGVLDDCIYAVGGGDDKNSLNSVEVFDVSNQKWRLVASMSTGRWDFGVGVLNNLLYVVGGGSNGKCLRSVEYYDPTLDTWTPVADIPSDGVWSSVADMEICRFRPGVVALDGLLYVMGGESDEHINDTVEIYNPKTNTWTMERLSRNGVQIYGGVVVDRPHHYH